MNTELESSVNPQTGKSNATRIYTDEITGKRRQSLLPKGDPIIAQRFNVGLSGQNGS